MRRIPIVTGGCDHLLLDFGVPGLRVPALATAVFLVRRARPGEGQPVP